MLLVVRAPQYLFSRILCFGDVPLAVFLSKKTKVGRIKPLIIILGARKVSEKRVARPPVAGRNVIGPYLMRELSTAANVVNAFLIPGIFTEHLDFALCGDTPHRHELTICSNILPGNHAKGKVSVDLSPAILEDRDSINHSNMDILRHEIRQIGFFRREDKEGASRARAT